MMAWLLLAAVTDVWAGLATHPAVVNPVSYEKFGRPETVISLAGEWDFFPARHGSGHRTCRHDQDLWAKSPKRCKVTVPGCWEASGVGEAGMGVPHLCADNAPDDLRHMFVGEGWYRTHVVIPADWRGKRVWLKCGGVKSQGWFYVNDQAVAWLDSGNGAWKWDVTALVRPGETNKIVAVADNAVAARGGPSSSGNRYGGLWRDVEMEVTPEVCIDDAWVRGDFDARTAEAHVVVDGGAVADLKGARLRVSVEDAVVEAEAHVGENIVRVPLNDFRPWTPESPNLYWAKAELLDKSGAVTMTRHERFGVRKLEARGKSLFLNGRPFFVRGFGDNAKYPITGVPPADRAPHRAHLAKARASGFNYVRQHTHADAPEYMEAADEVGLLVAPEIPYYLDNPNDYFSYDPIRDVDDMVVAFRRHVSFAVLSFGNEGLLGPAANRLVYEHAKKACPGLLVLAQDGGTYLCNHGEGCSDFCSGPVTTWRRGSFDPVRPFVCHEYMNLATKVDWRDAGDYTGLWNPPLTEAQRRAHLAHTGLSYDWLCRLQDAGHSLQACWQKNGIEHARADPFCDGYIYWTIEDSLPFSKAAGVKIGQGVYDAFWKTKRGGTTPEAMSVFNSASCVLIDTFDGVRDFAENTNQLLFCSSRFASIEGTNRVFVSGERIPVKFLFAHYGDKALREARLEWKLVADGSLLASGSCPIGRQELGAVRQVANLSITVPELTIPVRAELTATVVSVGDKGTSGCAASNSWPFWFFPGKPSVQVPGNVAVVPYGSADAEAARKAGKNVVLLANQTGKPNFVMGWWFLGNQVGMAAVEHPVFGSFPFERHLAPLHFGIVRTGLPLPVAGFSSDDCVMVGEGEKDAFVYLAAKTCADGRREVLVAGLDVTSETVEGKWLLGEVVKWAAGKDRPQVRVVAFGDSITQGVIGIRLEENWLRLLQVEMGDGYRMFNAGIGGNSAREAMARFERDVLSRAPDVVLIEFGGNNNDPHRPERRVGDDEFRRHLRTFRDGLPKSCKVVAITFPPLKEEWHRRYLGVSEGAPKEVYPGNAGLDSQRQILRDFARESGWPVVDLYEIMKDRHERLVLRDGVHLNPEGQKVFADAVRKVLKR